MKTKKQVLSFDTLEAEMDLLNRSEMIRFKGGTGPGPGQVTQYLMELFGYDVSSSQDANGNWTISVNGGPPVPLTFQLDEVEISPTGKVSHYDTGATYYNSWVEWIGDTNNSGGGGSTGPYVPHPNPGGPGDVTNPYTPVEDPDTYTGYNSFWAANPPLYSAFFGVTQTSVVSQVQAQWISNLGDNYSIKTFQGAITGQQGFIMNYNTTIENGDISSFNLTLENITVSYVTSMGFTIGNTSGANTTTVGFSLQQGLIYSTQINYGASFTGSEFNGMAGGYTLGAALILAAAVFSGGSVGSIVPELVPVL